MDKFQTMMTTKLPFFPTVQCQCIALLLLSFSVTLTKAHCPYTQFWNPDKCNVDFAAVNLTDVDCTVLGAF